jgi:hypothetical protein
MLSRPTIPILCTLLLLLASGCAPLEWRHTGSGEHNVDNDQAQCTAQARLEARQRLPLQPAPVPQVIVDQQGRTIVVQNTKLPDSERFFLEQSLLRQCMTERGYILESRPPKPE